MKVGIKKGNENKRQTETDVDKEGKRYLTVKEEERKKEVMNRENVEVVPYGDASTCRKM